MGGDPLSLAAWVGTTKKLPIKLFLKYCGLQLIKEKVKQQYDLGINFKNDPMRLIVYSVSSDSPFYSTGLREDDEIIAINHRQTNKTNINDIMLSTKFPAIVKLTLFREKSLFDILLKIKNITKYEFKIKPVKKQITKIIAKILSWQVDKK